MYIRVYSKHYSAETVYNILNSLELINNDIDDVVINAKYMR